MSLSRMKEAWGDYKKVVNSDYKNVNIKNFRYSIETIIIPVLKDINIDVDINSASTLSSGEVGYEAIADDNLITISFMSNNAEASVNQLFAEVYTMSGKASVGVLSLDNTEEIKELFLDAMEELGLDVTDKKSDAELKQDKFAKSLQTKAQKPVTKQLKKEQPKKEIPLPPEEPEEEPGEDNSETEQLRPLLDVYQDAIQAYIQHGRINNQMIIQIKNVKRASQYSFITCYYVDRTKCLAQCGPLELDQLVTYTSLGKYLVDLSSIYQTTLITVYDGNEKEVFSEEVAEYKEGGEE